MKLLTVEIETPITKTVAERIANPPVIVSILRAGNGMLEAAIDRLKNYNVGRIKVICILASENGLKKVHHFHPDVEIYTINVENEINEMGYFVPGLGDAGDRLFQTR